MNLTRCAKIARPNMRAKDAHVPEMNIIGDDGYLFICANIGSAATKGHQSRHGPTIFGPRELEIKRCPACQKSYDKLGMTHFNNMRAVRDVR